jgi:hypothetical protein
MSADECPYTFIVIAGLDPAIHAGMRRAGPNVDARVKPGHDNEGEDLRLSAFIRG